MNILSLWMNIFLLNLSASLAESEVSLLLHSLVFLSANYPTGSSRRWLEFWPGCALADLCVRWTAQEFPTMTHFISFRTCFVFFTPCCMILKMELPWRWTNKVLFQKPWNISVCQIIPVTFPTNLVGRKPKVCRVPQSRWAEFPCASKGTRTESWCTDYMY